MKHAGHGFKMTHIEHFDDGSATVHHESAEGPDKDIKHAVADLDEIHDSLQDHLNTPEAIEACLEARGIDPERIEEILSPGIHEEIGPGDEEKQEEKISPGIHQKMSKLAEEFLK